MYQHSSSSGALSLVAAHLVANSGSLKCSKLVYTENLK